MKKYLVLKTDDFLSLCDYFGSAFPELEVTPGYVNGTTAFPTFEMVSSGQSDHSFGVKVDFDDSKTPIEAIVEKYLFYIEGKQVSGIFYNDLLDGVECEVTITENGKTIREIPIEKLCNFFPAERRFRKDY